MSICQSEAQIWLYMMTILIFSQPVRNNMISVIEPCVTFTWPVEWANVKCKFSDWKPVHCFQYIWNSNICHSCHNLQYMRNQNCMTWRPSEWTNVSVCQCMPVYARVCQCMPVYASKCQCMPLYAGVCQCMPVYASVSQRMPVCQSKVHSLKFYNHNGNSNICPNCHHLHDIRAQNVHDIAFDFYKGPKEM